jgi:hypothetical protein
VWANYYHDTGQFHHLLMMFQLILVVEVDNIETFLLETLLFMLIRCMAPGSSVNEPIDHLCLSAIPSQSRFFPYLNIRWVAQSANFSVSCSQPH